MPVRYVLNRLKRFFIYRVLHVDDTPHRIALGVAIGIFVTWTPTIGFQMVLTVALSALLRANKAVGVPFVWISNPLTLGPVYGPNYLLGCWLLGGRYHGGHFLHFLKAAASGSGWMERLNAIWKAMWTIFWPLWTGSIVVGLLLGLLSYFATRWAVIRYRRHWHRKHPAPWKSQEPEAAGGGGE
jgi:hypothetical protein